jgi:hypothetical protein
VIPQGAEGLRVLAGAPSREELERRGAPGAAGRLRRPVLSLGMDGASVPSRPARARGRRPGQARPRARRARWPHAWRAAQGVRCALRAGERRVQGRSWQQGHKEPELGEAVPQGQAAGWLPEEAVRLWVGGAGAAWRGQHVPALCPKAGQGLDSSHCAEDLPKVATAQEGQTFQALAWGEAPLTRWSMDKGGTVLGGLRRMQPTSAAALTALDNGWG